MRNYILNKCTKAQFQIQPAEIYRPEQFHSLKQAKQAPKSYKKIPCLKKRETKQKKSEFYCISLSKTQL